MAKSIKGSQDRYKTKSPSAGGIVVSRESARAGDRSIISGQGKMDKAAMGSPKQKNAKNTYPYREDEDKAQPKKRQESTKKTTQKAMGPNTRQSPGTLFKPSVGKAKGMARRK